MSAPEISRTVGDPLPSHSMYIIRPPPMSTRLANDSARDVVESKAQAQAAPTHEKAATATTSTVTSWRPPRAQAERTVRDVVGRVVMTYSLQIVREEKRSVNVASFIRRWKELSVVNRVADQRYPRYGFGTGLAELQYCN